MAKNILNLTLLVVVVKLKHGCARVLPENIYPETSSIRNNLNSERYNNRKGKKNEKRC